jgi:hypothetical protein
MKYGLVFVPGAWLKYKCECLKTTESDIHIEAKQINQRQTTVLGRFLHEQSKKVG